MTTLLLAAFVIPAGEIPPADALNSLATAPPVSDRFRFPNSAFAEWALRFNSGFTSKVDREWESWPEERHAGVFAATLREAAELREAWEALAWAQWHSRPDWRRRLDLKRLRESLGDDAYRAGLMPPVVPSWRCRVLPQ